MQARNNYQCRANEKSNNIDLKISNGRVDSTLNSQLETIIITPIQETGLKELLQEATAYYDEGNIKIAVEKLWGAFERLKTYYSPNLDKKKSINKIIKDIAYDKKLYSCFRRWENRYGYNRTSGLCFACHS